MKFSFYRADALYCDYLRKSDPCVPYTMDQKEARPFIGIVLTLNDYDYYAPPDDKATVDYKNLLANQLSWCNTSANAASIIQKAEKLYRIITSKTARPQLAKRCCDFRVLEVAMDHYIDCQHMQDDPGLRSAMAKLNPVTHTQEQPVAHDKEQDWTH